MSLSNNPFDVIDPDKVKRLELPEILSEEQIRKNKLATASQLESIEKQAYEEGEQRGYQDGMKRSDEELEKIKEKARQFDTLMIALTQPFNEMDEQVVQQMADLSIAIARQLIRRELHIDKRQVIAIAREAMTELPVGSRNIKLYLNPEDAQLVLEAFTLNDRETSSEKLWQVFEDPALTRGGCRVTSEHSVIDATVEARFNRVINQLLGGERQTDEPEA